MRELLVFSVRRVQYFIFHGSLVRKKGRVRFAGALLSGSGHLRGEYGALIRPVEMMRDGGQQL
jgi:hypothetical protein